MKKIANLLVALCFATAAHGATSITTPMVSGHWTIAGSPYNIYNNVTVDFGQTLTIDPGVEVVFQGYYSIFVQGAFHACGTGTSPIFFHAQDTMGLSNSSTTNGGWAGLNLSYYSSDSCTLQYCNIANLKSSLVEVYYRNMTITGCNFFNNKNADLSINVHADQNVELASCKFYSNDTFQIFNWIGNFYVHNCRFYNSNDLAYDLAGGKMLFRDNEMDNNMGGHIRFTQASSGTTSYFPHGTIINNKIHHNINTENGVLTGVGRLSIIGNLVANNQHIQTGSCGVIFGGGGMFLEGSDSSFFDVRNNVIVNNYSADRGGALEIFQSDAIIANNTIVNNKQEEGGAIYIYNAAMTHSKVTVRNNLINNNKTPLYAGTPQENLNVYICGDTLDYNNNFGTHLFGESIVFGSPGVLTADTTNNIVAATPVLASPTLLADPAENALPPHSFALLASSPCVNTGSSTGIIVDTFDYSHHTRVIGRIDIGACEYDPAVSLTVAGQLGNTPSIRTYPNPASNILFVTAPSPIGNIELVDVYGKVVAQTHVSNGDTAFNVQSFARGVYFAVWTGNNQKISQKIVLE